jgi:hypothetical protein
MRTRRTYPARAAAPRMGHLAGAAVEQRLEDDHDALVPSARRAVASARTPSTPASPAFAPAEAGGRPEPDVLRLRRLRETGGLALELLERRAQRLEICVLERDVRHHPDLGLELDG